VFERPLRYLAVLVSLVVLASFAMFAIDEFRGASTATQTAIASQQGVHAAAVTTSTAVTSERLREQRHSQAREAIDDLNDVATAPFNGLVAHSRSTWVRHGVPTLLVLIFFGLGFAFLARFAKGSPHSRHPRPRRAGV
jgi:hypothetical protein